MSSAWSASPAASTPRLLIERAHEELLAGNTHDERLQSVRAVVRSSWERSWRLRVGAEDQPPVEIHEDELDDHRAEHPLAAMMPTIRSLLLPGSAEDSGIILAVSDERGRLLWVEGDLPQRVMAANMGFVAGTNWAEEYVGTSAPGVALALQRPVQIRDAEHYNRLVQPWSCTAAPVFDPETRELLGIIDVTGGSEAATPQAGLLMDATVRAVEAELLVARLRARDSGPVPPSRPQRQTSAMLRVLGRDRALLEVERSGRSGAVELSARHAEILLVLAAHRQGLSAERLAELVYGDGAFADTLRPEMVRLRRILQPLSAALVPDSRPYRLPAPLQTDAQNVLALLGRGSHRVALNAYRGPVLPESASPGVEEVRDAVRGALREAMLTEASIDVLLAYADIPEGADDVEVLRLCLELLPARSPRRAALVNRIERIETAA